MASLALALPCVPGGADHVRRMAAECQGSRHAEFVDFHHRMGLTSERWYLQQTPQGDLVIITLEGDPVGAVHRLASSDQPFDQWFKEQSRTVHGVDLNLPLPGPPPELLLEG